jgi:hypothetical protein
MNEETNDSIRSATALFFRAVRETTSTASAGDGTLVSDEKKSVAPPRFASPLIVYETRLDAPLSLFPTPSCEPPHPPRVALTRAPA